MSLPEPSEEQAAVVDALASFSVICDAVAGSGKTTTILHAVAAYPERRCLILTYNARLKAETRAKLADLCLGADAENYHSFGVKYISKKCCRDDGLREFLQGGAPARTFPQYDMVFIDEAQDMNSLYYGVAAKIVGDARLCILGDRRQNIYGSINMTHSAYLTHADRIWGGREWVRLSLSTSYRLTDEMANFLNGCILRERRLAAVKEGPRVRWINDDRNTAKLANTILRYGAKEAPDSIFILAPSVRRKKARASPTIALANRLSELGVPLYIPGEEQELAASSRLVFASFHQVKGLERDTVFVMGVDDSYYKYYDTRNPQKDTCPNALYVAMTRAKKHLIIVKSASRGHLPFVDSAKLDKLALCEGSPEMPVKEAAEQPRPKESVTNYVRGIPGVLMDSLRRFAAIEILRDAADPIEIPYDVDGEPIADINGIVIGMYLDGAGTVYRHRGKIAEWMEKHGLGEPPCGEDLISRTHYACCYEGWLVNLAYRLRQIRRYNWIGEEARAGLCENVSSALDQYSDGPRSFETPREVDEICGSTDMETPQQTWEFKCVRALLPEHELQLCLYAWMRGEGENMLVNATTGEVRKITLGPDFSRYIAALKCHKLHYVQAGCEEILANLGELGFPFCSHCSGKWGEFL